MADSYIKIHKALLPLSFLYGLGVRFRNMLFNHGILHSHTFDVPIISVGNITVGGTGKTPHVEYLIRLLQSRFKVGVLSRGYKRKSHGYVLTEENTTMRDVGDEPFQMKNKYPQISMAVDAKRGEGIEKLCEDEHPEVILLDDAFQHRYVKPGISIMLIDYFRLIYEDKLLPAGNLREPQSGKNRANIVIVTKCPRDIKPMNFRVITKNLNLYPYQTLYFTKLVYGKLYPLFISDKTSISLEELTDKSILLLTGIASPQRMLEDLKEYNLDITTVTFGDHHSFNAKDIERIRQTYDDMKGEHKIIITTEKDAVRLKNIDGQINQILKENLYILTLEIEFELEKKEICDKSIIDYVRKNKRNGSVHS